MGNAESTQQQPTSDSTPPSSAGSPGAGGSPVMVEKPSEAEDEVIPLFVQQQPQQLQTQQQPRRIVKATLPKVAEDAPGAVVTETEAKSTTPPEEAEEKEKIPYMIEKSSTASEKDNKKKIEDSIEATLKKEEERQRQKREQKKQAYRKGERSVTPTKKTTTAPNPMSRFLSAFSVQPAHPEHKRAFEMNDEDKAELKEPSEKRRRPSEPQDGERDDDNYETKDICLFSKKQLMITSAVAVVAIAAALLMRWKRSK